MLLAHAVEERIVADDERASAPLGKSREGGIEVGLAADVGDVQASARSVCAAVSISFNCGANFGTFGIDENTDQCGRGHQLAHEFEPLGEQFGRQPGDAGGRAPRPTEARHQAEFHRVVAGEKNQRNGRTGFAHAERRADAAGNDDGCATLNEIGREHRQPIEMTLRPAIFDDEVPTVDEADLGKALAERDEKIAISADRAAVEKSDHRHRRLLRARRERPRSRRAAERGYGFQCLHADRHLPCPAA